MSKVHVIEAGECLTSVAYREGFYPDSIWDHASNADLKKLRKEPNALLAGDRLVIPDKGEKREPCATGKRHEFRRRGVPARLRLRLMNVETPRKDLAYRLTIDDAIVIEGKTDGDGAIDVPLPPNAKHAVLLLIECGSSLDLELGHLDPVTERSGVAQRLGNLGYLRGDEPPTDPSLKEAITRFQAQFGLSASGEADAPTREKLSTVHETKAAMPKD